jgi:hypothetical protein
MAPREDDGGADFAGIDPGLMRQMIKDLETAKGGVDDKIPGLKSSFEKAGLDTKPIATLTGVASWVGGELPMLNRRQGMAEQLSKENNQFGFGSGMVPTEWGGLFKSKKDAQAKAKELAAKYQKPGGFPDDAWKEIEKYQNDPDFAEAFLKELGPEKAAWIASRLSTWNEKGHQERFQAFATLVATASHRGVINDAWLKKFETDGSEGPNLPLLSALIKYGIWDQKTLVNIGQRAIDHDQLGGGDYLTADILDSVARNPLAANELYSKNFDKINSMVRGQRPGWMSHDPKLGDPLGRFITAATVDARDAFERTRPPGDKKWTNPAEELTRRLLLDVKANKDHPPAYAGVRLAYTGIAEAYFDDLRASVTSPLPDYFDKSDPGRPGVEADAAAWAALTQQAMRDPKNAAELNLFFSAKYQEASDRITGDEFPDAKDANSLSNYQNGQLKGWFLHQVTQTQATLGGEVDAYNKEVDKWVGLFVDTAAAAGTAAATGGGGAVAAGTAAKDSIKGFVSGLGTDKAKQWIGGWFHKDAPDFKLDTKWATDSTAYQDKANSSLFHNKIQPVKDPGNGITWDGKPSFYEDLYGGKFTDSGNHIMPVQDMSPAGKRAYMEWLQDPAVQEATWNEFNPDKTGKDGQSGN